MVQEVGVALVVIGAVTFLVRRLFGRGSGKPKGATFVPIGKLRKKPDRNCH